MVSNILLAGINTRLIGFIVNNLVKKEAEIVFSYTEHLDTLKHFSSVDRQVSSVTFIE